jgi:hypothetical protein
MVAVRLWNVTALTADASVERIICNIMNILEDRKGLPPVLQALRNCF